MFAIMMALLLPKQIIFARCKTMFKTNICEKNKAIEKIKEGIMGLVIKSNVHSYFPFISPFIIILAGSIPAVLCFLLINPFIKFAPTAASISFLAFALPFVVLDLMAKNNYEKIRFGMGSFVSVLNRWCSVKEDIFYAFEKSVYSDINPWIKNYISQMVTQINMGMEPVHALEMLDEKLKNPQFSDLIINIKHVVRHRGDICRLLSNLENQFYRVEQEICRRNISTFKDRICLYLLIALSFSSGMLLLLTNSKAYDFYINTISGKWVLFLFCIVFLLGFVQMFKSMQFNY